MLQHGRYRKMDMAATDDPEGISHHVLPGARPKKTIARTEATQGNRRIDTVWDILGPRPPAPSTASRWGQGAHGLRQPRESARAQELDHTGGQLWKHRLPAQADDPEGAAGAVKIAQHWSETRLRVR